MNNKSEFDNLKPSTVSERTILDSVRKLLTKGRGHTDDKTFARGELLGQVDLLTGGAFDEVDIGDRITDFDHFGGGLMEGSDGFVR